MRRPALWAATGVLLGVTVAAVVWLPARWLAPWVSQLTEGRVVWVQPQGTLWNGGTRLALTGGAGSQDRTALPGTWTWRLSPQWRGGPGVTLNLGSHCCTKQPIQVSVQWKDGLSWQVSDADITLPLSPLQGLGTPWNTLALQGQIHINTVALSGLSSASRHNVKGQVNAQVNNVSSRLTTVAPLGSYGADLRWPQQGLAQWSVRTLSGHLDIHGQGQIAQGRVRFRGEASASAETSAALANLLNIIGRRQGGVTLLTLG